MDRSSPSGISARSATAPSASHDQATRPAAGVGDAARDAAEGESPGDRSPGPPARPEAAVDASAQLPVPYVPQRRRALLQWVRNLLGMNAREDLRESLAGALDQGHGEIDALTDKERVMLRNVLQLRDVRVEDVMVPRADIDAVDLSLPLFDIMKAFEAAGHSRLPVTRESLDDPVGLVHIKDVMAYITAKATVKKRKSRAKATAGMAAQNKVQSALKGNGGPPARQALDATGDASDATTDRAATKARTRESGKVTAPHSEPAQPAPGSIDLSRVDLSVALKSTKLVREVLYVPPSMPVGDLLVKMQADRMHMAIVVDEYGGTDGLVTIEDLVEEIVGEISDEHDDEEAALIVSSGPSGFVADARTPIEDLIARLGGGFQPDAEVLEEIDTLGGLLFSQLGRVPVRGELVDLPGDFEFEVIDADPRRVKRVRISPRRVAAQTSQAPRKARAAPQAPGSTASGTPPGPDSAAS